MYFGNYKSILRYVDDFEMRIPRNEMLAIQVGFSYNKIDLNQG